ncbi:hypothetical protein BDY19DRAFT_507697 [Irpex rosettiformis]|uniref:Uncharacterized protein n=1 Tax=Irpex rosettiformis TaxID=378272 RepID=A0ACB8UEP1_9APHY|nr:hypothetical protein BDY19DRAFT_507697 [Irpex rosettiformis]
MRAFLYMSIAYAVSFVVASPVGYASRSLAHRDTAAPQGDPTERHSNPIDKALGGIVNDLSANMGGGYNDNNGGVEHFIPWW